ncbi:ribonuclease Z [Phanerochaete sordida]|uniref:Ribonuclease Z n=1 Tax=Phanerochaete sordida TaxID=48140 RepID=A0A9P3G988_9APHY|nr:ribonuclease Z [Phanerochaete sordida]
MAQGAFFPPAYPRNNMVVTFLGTTSGGGPTDTRNCSSLVVDAVGNGQLWMVDCAEGTVRQFATQPYHDARRVRISDIKKVFITHMHADHTMGLITLLRNALGIHKGDPHEAPREERPVRAPKIEIYGPRGMRQFVRTIFSLTHTRSADQYCVHELLMPGETASASGNDIEELHPSEEPGTNIPCDADGYWREVTSHKLHGGSNHVVVDAGPIVHRDPCIGYIFREDLNLYPTLEDSEAPYKITPRMIVALGDTSDPSALAPLVAEAKGAAVSLLVHEATDAWMPPHVDRDQRTGRNRTERSVMERAVEKGHSTPAMAGHFARQIGAERLALNHIGARFPAPPHAAHTPRDKFRRDCMAELEAQATRAWAPANGARAMAVQDYDRIVVPPNAIVSTSAQDEGDDMYEDAEHGQSGSTRHGLPPKPGVPGGHGRYRGHGGHHGDSRKRENSGGQAGRREGGDSKGRHWDQKKQRRHDDGAGY